MALRFTLGNRDLSTRVIGVTELAQLDEALAAVERGPLPPEAIAKLDQLWATDFYMNGELSASRGAVSPLPRELHRASAASMPRSV